MNHPKISIVIPIYNVEPYIADCLRSVASQTYQGVIECLLIDDCGTDKSIEIAETFVASYKGNVIFRILKHAHNRGLSAARNTGTEQATGDYVYFLDSDDEIDEHCLEWLTQPLLSGEACDILVGGYRVTGTGSAAPALHLSDGTTLEGDAIMRAYVKGEWYVMAWNKLCSLSFLRKYRLTFKEGLIHEDELWTFQVACRAARLRVVNRPCYVYKLREGSIMVNDKAKGRRVLTMMGIIEDMTDYLLREHLSSPYATMLIMEKSYIDVWHELLYMHTDTDYTTTCCMKCRHQISRLPYLLRAKVCSLGMKQAIRYLGALLPIRLFIPYYRMLDHIYKLKK